MPYADRAADGNYDGVSDCINTGTEVMDQHLIGRFPVVGQFATSGCGALTGLALGLDLRDGDGERLWYAVSPYLLFNGDSYEVSGTPLNTSVNTGLLDIPGVTANPDSRWLVVRDARGNVLSDRVAAVILAPGGGLTGQEARDGATPAATEYLDQVTVSGTTYSNADNDRDFIVYPHSDTTAAGNDRFNDRLVYVTVDELMPKVEQRVLGEVSVVLNTWRNTWGAFPWLSPVAASLAASDYTGAIGQRAGYLSYIDIENAETYPFESGLSVTWSQGDAEFNLDPISAAESSRWGGPFGLTVVFLQPTSRNDMDVGNFNAINNFTVPMPSAPSTGAQCQWNGNPGDVICSYTSPVQVVGTLIVCTWSIFPPAGVSCPTTVDITRVMELELNFAGTQTGVSTNAGARGRDANSGAEITLSGGSDNRLTVTDTAVVPDHVVAGAFVPGWTVTVERELDAEDGDTANFAVSGIYYEPRSDGAAPGDLPDWFSDEGWGPYVYVRYADSFLPAEGGSCTPGADCLLLDIYDPADPAQTTVLATANNVAAVALSAGAAVGANTARIPLTGASETSFFETDNNDGDDRLDRKIRSTAFTDQARIVATVP